VGEVLRYRTIVADPPWDHSDGTGVNIRDGGRRTHLPYETMTVDEIAALPIPKLSEGDKWHIDGARGGSHLYLWTTTRYLCAAHEVARAWRFIPSAVLVWCKPVRGFNVGGTFPSNVEFCIYARRGSPPATGRTTSRWFTWRRGEHSRKPEAFYDLVEELSPGPYLELFARRQRLGWDTWGDEALEHVSLGASA
jgi:N6-adenosine-specific RNA methylase IME4